MPYQIIHEEKYQQFTVKLPHNEEAEVAYAKPEPHLLDLMHTFVPDAHRGEGLAKQLLTHALQFARQHELKVIATCGVAKKFIQDNPTYQDLLYTA